MAFGRRRHDRLQVRRRDGHEGVPEVERHLASIAWLIAVQRAALDGQISRNGQ